MKGAGGGVVRNELAVIKAHRGVRNFAMGFRKCYLIKVVVFFVATLINEL